MLFEIAIVFGPNPGGNEVSLSFSVTTPYVKTQSCVKFTFGRHEELLISTKTGKSYCVISFC